jgi:hypothetical protein
MQGLERQAGDSTSRQAAYLRKTLAHTIRNKVEGAYARSGLFEKRRKLMEAWAQHLGMAVR